MRRKILEGDDIKPEILRLIAEKARDLTLVPAKNNPQFADQFESVFPLDDEKITAIGIEKKDKIRLQLAIKDVEELYAAKEEQLTPEVIRKVEREIYLQVLDTLWMQHLENMQHLREGIHWRSVGQRDPLVEYRAESAKLFDSLQATLRDEVLRAIMHVRPNDVLISAEEEHDTELTRLAESAVERGVNEVTLGETNRDEDFGKVAKAKKVSDVNKVKNDARKKKKSQRQNRKKNRK